jgi:hypothetical protein
VSLLSRAKRKHKKNRDHPLLIGIVVAGGGRARTKEGNNKVKNTHITQKAAQKTHTPETRAPSRSAARGVARRVRITSSSSFYKPPHLFLVGHIQTRPVHDPRGLDGCLPFIRSQVSACDMTIRKNQLLPPLRLLARAFLC